MLYEDDEEPADYSELESEQDPDYNGRDDDGYYEGGVGSEPSFTFPLDREPQPRDFKSYEARPWGHRQPKPPEPRQPQPSIWETVTGRKESPRKRWYTNSSWTAYGSF